MDVELNSNNGPYQQLLKTGASILVVASAAWVRFYRLGGESLWHDEAFTWWFTRLPWLEMLDTVRLDGVNPPVYYLAVKPFLLSFGDSETSLRILSAAAGVLTVFLVMRMGEKVAGSVGGFAAGWFWAFHPMAIWFSRDARPYALAAFLAVALLTIYLATRASPSPKLWVLAFTVLALGQLTHYFFFLLGGIIVLLAMLELGVRPLHFRGWASIVLAAFLPLAAWLGWYFNQPNPSLGIGWIQRPVLSDPLLTLWNLAAGYGGVFSAATLIFGLVVLLMGGFAFGANEDPRLVWGVLALGLILPLAAVWVVSQRRPVFVDRYFIILLPFVSLLFAVGARKAIDRLAPFLVTGHDLYLPMGVLLVLLAFGNWLGWQVHLDPAYKNEDWRGLVRILAEEGDSVSPVWFSEPEASIPFQYYYRGEIEYLPSLTPPVCEQPCWWVMRQPYTAIHAYSQTVPVESRPWQPVLPLGCSVNHMWNSHTNVGLWKVQCYKTGE